MGNYGSHTLNNFITLHERYSVLDLLFVYVIQVKQIDIFIKNSDITIGIENLNLVLSHLLESFRIFSYSYHLHTIANVFTVLFIQFEGGATRMMVTFMFLVSVVAPMAVVTDNHAGEYSFHSRLPTDHCRRLMSIFHWKVTYCFLTENRPTAAVGLQNRPW